MPSELENFVHTQLEAFRQSFGTDGYEGPGIALALHHNTDDYYFNRGKVPTKGSSSTAPVSQTMVFEIGSMTKSSSAQSWLTKTRERARPSPP